MRAAVVCPGRKAGFTLVEVLVVVAILGIAVSFVFSAVIRSTDYVEIDQAARQLKTRIEEVRGLAAVAGARLGTPRFQNCDGSNQLVIAIQPFANTYTLPRSVEYDAATDVMTARCETFDVAAETNGAGRFDLPNVAALNLAFTATGRVLQPAQPTPAGTLFFRIRHTRDVRAYGFRILPSGIICTASDPAVVDCDRDT